LCPAKQSINFKGFHGQRRRRSHNLLHMPQIIRFPNQIRNPPGIPFQSLAQKLNRIYHGSAAAASPRRCSCWRSWLQDLACNRGPNGLLNFHASAWLIIRRNKRKLKCNWQHQEQENRNGRIPAKKRVDSPANLQHMSPGTTDLLLIMICICVSLCRYTRTRAVFESGKKML